MYRVVLSLLICLMLTEGITTSFANVKENPYRWAIDPAAELNRVEKSRTHLNKAMTNPEYLIDHWIDLPTAPKQFQLKRLHLTLQEAILLALRYNPNIQNAELDRIIQRYQLRLAKNQFELQYALAGSGIIERARYSNVGNATTRSLIATPEVNWRNRYGGEVALGMDNNIQPIGGYNPLINFTVSQPLLRGFGRNVNEVALLNALDADWLNKLQLKQSVIDQVTQVIQAYRTMVLSGNNLENQKSQLVEAKHSFEVNEKRIAAGQLEPMGNIQQSYQIESLSLMVEQAENDFKIASQNLLQAIGLDPQLNIAVPSDIILDHLSIPNLEETIKIGLNQNVSYQALKKAYLADKRAYKIAQNQQLWQLDLKANVQAGTMTDVNSTNRNIQSIYNGRNLTESAGIVLNIPIHDLSRKSELITAKVKLEKDRLTLLAAKRELITLIQSTIYTIQSQVKQFELAKRQVELASRSYTLEKKKLEAGISTSLDVNNTQNQLIQSQRGLIQAKVSYLNALSNLQRIIGTTLDEWHITLRFGNE